MENSPISFSNITPHEVNSQTLLLCEKELREPIVKSLLRLIYSRYLQFRYGIKHLGKGFQWGKWRKRDIRRGVLKIGNFVFIGPRVSIIYPTVIGDLCMISSDTYFIGNDHGIDQPGIPTRLAQPEKKPERSVTILESDVWIGQRSTIFAGVKIGRGSVVAAGSVVTRDIPPYTIVAGVPAKQLKKRFKNEVDENHHEQSVYGCLY